MCLNHNVIPYADSHYGIYVATLFWTSFHMKIDVFSLVSLKTWLLLENMLDGILLFITAQPVP